MVVLFLVGPLIAPLVGQVMMIFPPCTTSGDVSWAIISKGDIMGIRETRGWEITLCFLSG